MTRSIARSDVLLCAVIAVLGVVQLFTVDLRGEFKLNLLGVLVVSCALLWRRRHPLAISAVCGAVLILMSAFLTTVEEMVFPFIPLLLCSFGNGAYLSGRRSQAGLAIMLTVIVSVNLVMGSTLVGDFFFPSTFATLAWLAGRTVRNRTELAAELHETAARAQEAHAESSARAAAEERRRIARELHDVVAHSMSVMVVQAGGARRILDRDPARARAAAEQIERTGREALTEMRRLLGVLHVEEGKLAPQPGLDGLPSLVQRARDAGLPVELTFHGERPPLEAGLEFAAYRIVQEGLTNAIKHAGAAPTRVDVHYDEEAIELVISDSGPGPVNGESGGHGLIGMRERVRVFGGSFDAGAGESGGFVVRARVPRGVAP